MNLNRIFAEDINALFTEIGEQAEYNGKTILVIPGGSLLELKGGVRSKMQSFIIRSEDVATPEVGDKIIYKNEEWTVDDPGGVPAENGRQIWTVMTVRHRRPKFNT